MYLLIKYDWTISVQVIIQAMGLVSIILLFIQLRMNNHWNKMREALNIAVKDNLSARNRELIDEMTKLDISLNRTVWMIMT